MKMEKVDLDSGNHNFTISVPPGMWNYIADELKKEDHFGRSELIRTCIRVYKDYKHILKKIILKEKFIIDDLHYKDRDATKNGEKLYDFEQKMSYL